MLLGPGSDPVAKTFFLAAGVLGLAVGAATAPVAAGQPGGAASAVPASPAISTIACSSGCIAPDTVEQGGTVTLGGRQLDRASAVVFLGGRGTSDDARVRVRAKSSSSVDVRVPATARSGQVVVATATGVASQARGVSIRIVKPAAATLAAPAAPVLRPIAGVAQLDAGFLTSKAGKGASGATIAYVSHAPEPVSVRVDVVRVADGLSIFKDERSAAAEQQQTIEWDGRGDAGLALDGKYEVRISSMPASAPRAATPAAGTVGGGAAPEGSPPPSGSASVGGFTFVGAVFPVRGVHNYGQSAARFGAGRSGRSHEGQDVMAKCGTPVVAARGGVVKQKATHSAAGNYVVISDEATGEDHSYMHFRAPALVERGDRVETGQQIGVVGDTGSASACHLHFEIWTAPGWYEGGSAIDPFATLKRWDRLG